MRLFASKVPTIATECVRALLTANEIEAEAPKEVESDIEAVLKNYLTTEKVQTALYKSGGRLPALTAAADKVDDPVLAGFNAAGATGAPMPSIPEMGSVWSFWGTTQVQIISGQVGDPAAAWDTMITNIQGAIAKG